VGALVFIRSTSFMEILQMVTPDAPTQFDVGGAWAMWICPKGSTQATFFACIFNDDNTFTAGKLTTPFSGTWKWDRDPFQPFTIMVAQGSPVGLQAPFTMSGFLVAGENGGAMGGGVGSDPNSPDAIWSAAKVPLSGQ
jgi:hypothetical protein